MVSSQPVKDPVSKEVHGVFKDDTQGWPPLYQPKHKGTHTHQHSHVLKKRPVII